MAAVRRLCAGFVLDMDSAGATAFAGRPTIRLGWRIEASTNLAAAVRAGLRVVLDDGHAGVATIQAQ
jgi:hypothetical protein